MSDLSFQNLSTMHCNEFKCSFATTTKVIKDNRTDKKGIFFKVLFQVLFNEKLTFGPFFEQQINRILHMTTIV